MTVITYKYFETGFERIDSYFLQDTLNICTEIYNVTLHYATLSKYMQKV